MGTRDARIDAYIAKSADFAQPILEHLREIVHQACPEVEETMKWSFPHFQYRGMLCSMAAFKEHCAFGFWRSSEVLGEGEGSSDKAMGSFGRLTVVGDLPSRKKLASYIKKAMALNDTGTKSAARSKPRTDRPLEVPDVLLRALETNAKARSTFEAFSTSKKRDYVDWINEAKSDATRERRLATTIEWLAEGKARNWKYDSC